MNAFKQAVALLKSGQLVAFPTDTVYGVGAIVWDGSAVGKLYEAKLRPPGKAIPVLLADPGDLQLVAAELSQTALRLAEAFWPGALTLIVPKVPGIPDEVTGGGASIAVRVPNHPVARALIRAAGAPLATTSANLSGQPSPITAQDVTAQLGGRIPLILDGGTCPGGRASTILDLTGPEPVIVRPGPITLDEIQTVLR